MSRPVAPMGDVDVFPEAMGVSQVLKNVHKISLSSRLPLEPNLLSSFLPVKSR